MQHTINLFPCLHEKADTRMQQMLSRKATGNTCVCVDTDVVAIAIAMLNQINPDELWLAFGRGSKLLVEWIPAVLPVFHVSSFGGRGEKTTWNIWQVFRSIQTPHIDGRCIGTICSVII